MPDDVAEIVEDVIYVRDHSEMTLHVKRSPDSESLTVEVTHRNK